MSNTETAPETFDSAHNAPGTAQNPQCEDGANVEIITAREVPLGGPRAMTVPVSYTHLDVYKRQG